MRKSFPMKYIRNVLILLVVLSPLKPLLAQTYEIDRVADFTNRGSGPILENKVVKGYYMFYYVELTDDDSLHYEILILDADLNQLLKKEIRSNKLLTVQESIYNGTCILFKFSDQLSADVVYRTVTKSGKVSEEQTRTANSAEFHNPNTVNSDNENVQLFAFGKSRFVDVQTNMNSFFDYDYRLTVLDNEGAELWNYSPSSNAKYLSAKVLAATESALFILETIGKNVITKDHHYNLIIFDKEGQIANRIEMESDDYTMRGIRGSYQEDREEVLILGDIYKRKKKVLKSESLGVFILKLNSLGEEKQRKFLTWKEDIFKSLSKAELKEQKDQFIYLQDINVLSDGRIIVHGEQYKRLKHKTNKSTYVSIGDIAIAVIDQDLNLQEFDFLERDTYNEFVADGYVLLNQHSLARYAETKGAFTYMFTIHSEDNSVLNTVYLIKKRNPENGMLLRSYSCVNFISEESEVSQDIIEAPSDDITYFVFPGKTGNIIIMEYNDGKSQLVFRMEPINY